MIKSKSVGSKTADVMIWFLVSIITFACFAPLLNTVAISFSDKTAVAANRVYLWPVKFTLASYEMIMSDGQFWRSFVNSLVRVLLGVSINLFLTILTAFPLSKTKKEFKLRNVYVWIVMFAMLFSGGTVPLYITVKKLHLLNSIWSLVLPGAVPVFDVILLMNFFRGVPKSLEEAAIVDGASTWRILFKVYLPISLPALATITLFCIVGHWNEFFSALIYINTPAKYPLQSYIQQVTINISTMNLSDPEELKRLSEITNRTLNTAKIVISTIPLLLIYPFLQKYFVKGIVMGSVKE